MIDVHCHLEQKEYDLDRDQVTETCKKAGLKAVITSSAHPRDLELTLSLAEKYKGFVYACFGLHPEFIKDNLFAKKVDQKGLDEYLEKLKENKKKIVAIGEIGLDFFWIKEKSWREKQEEQFVQLINFAKEIKKPLVVHSRDAGEETFKILEKEDCKKVLLHFFSYKDLVDRVIENKWSVSVNLLVTRNKGIRKIVQKIPIEQIMLETDAPWIGPQKPVSELKPQDKLFFKNEQIATLRNDPTTIKQTAEKISELKKLDFETVWKICGKNAERFFALKPDD